MILRINVVYCLGNFYRFPKFQLTRTLLKRLITGIKLRCGLNCVMIKNKGYV